MSIEYQRIKTPSHVLPNRRKRGKSVNITIIFVFATILLLVFAQFFYLDYNLNIIYSEGDLLHHNPSHLFEKRYVENIRKNDNDGQKSNMTDNKNLTNSYFERLLTSAGINIEDLSEETMKSLPSMMDVNDLYGAEPVIFGLEKCADFQAIIKPEDSFLAPAGMFNSVSPTCYHAIFIYLLFRIYIINFRILKDFPSKCFLFLVSNGIRVPILYLSYCKKIVKYQQK